MFRNIVAVRVPQNFLANLDVDFDGAISNAPLKELRPFEAECSGFLPIFSNGPALTHGVANATMLHLGTNKKILPASVLQSEVAKKVAAYEAEKGRRPGKRMRGKFKDDALLELLPKAFVKQHSVRCYIDNQASLLIVESGTFKHAESVCAAIREALGSFPARPIQTEASLPLVMSEWLVSGSLPEGFELDDFAEFHDPSDTPSTVRAVHHDLTTDEIREHARCGKQVTKLGLVFDRRISFVLGADLILRKVKLMDVVLEDLGRVDDADENAILDAEFALMVLELRRLYARLDEVLRFID